MKQEHVMFLAFDDFEFKTTYLKATFLALDRFMRLKSNLERPGKRLFLLPLS